MLSTFAKFARLGDRFRRNKDGNATIEFVVIFPFLVIFLLMFAEIGLFTAQSVLLKRGVDHAIRDIRLGVNRDADEEEFRASICDDAWLSRCEDELLIDMQPIDVATRANFGSQSISCGNQVDPDLTPATTFNTGGDGDIILVRVCMIVDPIFPGTFLTTGFQNVDSVHFAMVVTTAFRSECGNLDAC